MGHGQRKKMRATIMTRLLDLRGQPSARLDENSFLGNRTRHDIQQQGSYFSLSQSSFQCPFRSSSRVNIKDQLTCQNIKSKAAGGILTCHHDSLPQSAPLNALATHDKPQALFSSLEFLHPCVQVRSREDRQCALASLKADDTV